MSSVTHRPTLDLDRFIDRMDARIAEHSERGDARERFLLMYRTFKNELRRHLQAGRFADTAWSEAICCRMAEMYFEADEAYQTNRAECPEPWAYAFDAALAGRLNLLQDMLLGMNAHINFDLPVCAFDTMRLFGDVSSELPAVRALDHGDVAFDALLRQRYSDFLLINQIAWESIDRIQDVATRRFSRVLGVATRIERAGPIQLSRLITTRVISEYRDRAWGHTLLLLMAQSQQQLDTVKQITSRFAMDAADLVARVDFHPVRSMQLLRRGRVLPDIHRPVDLARTRAVIPFLVDQLANRSTRRVAARALTEYGPEIQTLLSELLEQRRLEPDARSQLLRVIAAHPTPVAAGALQAQMSFNSSAFVDESLRLLAGLRARDVHLDVDESKLNRSLELATWHASWTAGCYDGLGVRLRGWLLDETLRRRLVSHLQRMLLLEIVRNPDQRLMNAVGSLSPELAPDVASALATAVDSVAPGRGSVLVSPLTLADTVEATLEQAEAERFLHQLCFHTDPWLRACALHRVGEIGMHGGLEAILPALTASELRVREAALQACATVMPQADFRWRVGALLADMPGSWVREYAERLMAGDGAEDGVYSTIEKVLLLKNAELFVDVPAEELAEIAGVVQSGAFRKGQRLIAEGSPGEALYVLVRGEVDVQSADGRSLARVEPYSVLGETSILLDEPCTATCVAATAGHALRITRTDFEQLLRDYPDVTLGLLRVMTRRMKAANRNRGAVSSIVS